jgi:sugar lactone lactonase YvrE
MRNLMILISVAVALSLASPVAAAKIRHLGSIYADPAGLALKHPEGVACGESTLVVADTGNNRVVRYQLSAQGILPVASSQLEGVVPLIAQLNTDGQLYLLDGRSRQVVILDEQGQLKGKLELRGVPGSKTIVPRSFRLANGSLYLLDIFGERVLILGQDGKFAQQIAFPEGFRFFSDLTVDDRGTLYLLDSVAGAIYQANAGAEEFSLFSSGLKEFTNFPVSITTDKNGTLYLSDQYGSGLAEIGRDGSFQGRKFGMGWEEGQLLYPSQLCTNDQGILAIADRSNSRVQVFTILDE